MPRLATKIPSLTESGSLRKGMLLPSLSWKDCTSLNMLMRWTSKVHLAAP